MDCYYKERNYENAIKYYKEAYKSASNNQKKMELQRKTTNLLYSWDRRSIEWKNFFDEARDFTKK